MFEGSYPLMLDAKGRLTLPAELRPEILEQCAGKLTVARHFGPFLRVYPQPEWLRFRTFLAEKATVKMEDTRRLIVGTADPVQMDGAGRILVSPHLRKAVRLDRQVVLVGDITRFELWDQETLDRHLEKLASNGVPDELQNVIGI